VTAFDFDAWRELARQDPAEYFRRRELALEGFIRARPDQEAGLRALQREIDQTRALAGSPAKAAGELARMLGERLEALAGHLQQLDEQTGALQALASRAGNRSA
jgi:hypothetical protein